MKNIRMCINQNINVKKIIIDEVAKLFCDEGKYFFKTYSVDDKQICVFVSEDYSFSTNSKLTITLVSEAKSDQTDVNILVSGGKVGFVFETSYGSEKRRAKKIINIFSNYGFKEN